MKSLNWLMALLLNGNTTAAIFEVIFVGCSFLAMWNVQHFGLKIGSTPLYILAEFVSLTVMLLPYIPVVTDGTVTAHWWIHGLLIVLWLITVYRSYHSDRAVFHCSNNWRVYRVPALVFNFLTVLINTGLMIVAF